MCSPGRLGYWEYGVPYGYMYMSGDLLLRFQVPQGNLETMMRILINSAGALCAYTSVGRSSVAMATLLFGSRSRADMEQIAARAHAPPYTYTAAMKDFKTLLRRVSPNDTEYGLHGLRVAGWNLAGAAVDPELAEQAHTAGGRREMPLATLASTCPPSLTSQSTW